MKIKAVYANSRDSLTAKSLGLFHDRCYHLFAGKMEDVPMEYKELIKEKYLYILIYQEENIKY